METGEKKQTKAPETRAQVERRLENELWFAHTERRDRRRWEDGAEEEPRWVTEMKQRFEARGIEL